MISHDWPTQITDYGNTEQLLKEQPSFEEGIRKKRNGNPEAMNLLYLLKPKYWFSAHMHCHYEAKVHHNLINEGVPEETKFLALGRPSPDQKFIEVLQFPLPDDAKITFEYDSLWCAVLKNTDHLIKITSERLFIPSSPGPEQWDFRPTPEQIERVQQLFGNDFTVPENFALTAPPHRKKDNPKNPCLYYLNPQTTQFCNKLQITNFNQLLYLKTEEDNGIPYSQKFGRDTDRIAANLVFVKKPLVGLKRKAPELNPVIASESLEDVTVLNKKLKLNEETYQPPLL